MKLKTKLFSAIVAFMLVATMMIYGVFAASNIYLSFGGSVSFTATDVNVKLQGEVTGSTETNSLPDITISSEDNSTTVANKLSTGDWQNLKLTFDDSASPITVTIKISNLSSDREAKVILTDNTLIQNVTVVRKLGDSAISSKTDTRVIAAGTTLTYSFTLNLDSRDNSADGRFDIGMEITNVMTYIATINYDINMLGYGQEYNNGGFGFWYSFDNGTTWQQVNLTNDTPITGTIMVRNIKQIMIRIERAGGDWEINATIEGKQTISMKSGYTDPNGYGKYVTSSNYILEGDVVVNFSGYYED